jgi:amino acid adenylation domain-containing protein
VQSFHGATYGLTIPAELTAGLKRLSRAEGATLFMTLLAGFAAVLSRYSRQKDIVIGTPVAGRTQAETEGLIGFFVNTLALRVNLEGEPDFVELLRRVRGVTLGAYAHQDIPFEKLVEELQPARDLRHAPLFHVAFVWNNLPRQGTPPHGLALEVLEIGGRASKYDITVSLSESGDGLVSGDIEYSTDLFERATIERLAGHYARLLEQIAAEPERPVDAHDVLDEAERRQLLFAWNSTAADYPRTRCLHELFEAQAKRTPHAEALVDGHRRLTYADLNARANQLARRLRHLGVGPEVTVGVLTQRSAGMVAALLAVLKAGGAYVPLDPQYPAARLSFMLSDARARVLLTERPLLREHEWLSAHEVEVVCLDEGPHDDTAAHDDAPNLVTSATPDNLAYVIYTSGSTGQPKGVAIAHRNAVVLAHWARDLFSDEELSGVLAATSVCFDLSIFELFVPLSWGGRVILVQGALRLPECEAAASVTLVNTVPSVMAELVRAGGVPPSVRTVNLAGEPLPKRLVRDLYELEGIGRVLNLYGPSEDTTYSTGAEMPDDAQTRVLIGHPVANTQAHVLDERLRPVPVGAPGELYLGGDGLARGYLGRPDLTAERFIPNPYAGEPGARLYRTGDLARRMPEGQLDYLGRIDQQVKVRGFRIELGEVEAVLERHPAVREAVVVAQEGQEGGPRLIAYFVAQGDEPPNAFELRRHAQRQLPDYMLPATFVRLDALPLTTSGKVDRRALPAPGVQRPETERPFAGPRTPVEALLCDIWAELLQVERVGIEDNFFELGGHSLLATQMASRIRQAFEVELPLQVLFEFPTVSELAQAITASRAAQEDTTEMTQLLEELKQLSSDDVKLMLETEKP